MAGPTRPTAPDEIAAVAACCPRVHQLTGAAATTDAVRVAAAGAGMVRLACHGRLRTDSAASAGGAASRMTTRTVVVSGPSRRCSWTPAAASTRTQLSESRYFTGKS